jgi:hypothetical protein
MSAGIDAVQENQNYLLNMLLDSMLKPQELSKRLIPADAGEAVKPPKLEPKGDIVDLYV